MTQATQRNNEKGSDTMGTDTEEEERRLERRREKKERKKERTNDFLSWVILVVLIGTVCCFF